MHKPYLLIGTHLPLTSHHYFTPPAPASVLACGIKLFHSTSITFLT